MEIKKIVEGMTATEVAQVIDDNFKAAEADKANKTDVNASIAKLTETVETKLTETDGKLSELESVVQGVNNKPIAHDIDESIEIQTNDGETIVSVDSNGLFVKGKEVATKDDIKGINNEALAHDIDESIEIQTNDGETIVSVDSNGLFVKGKEVATKDDIKGINNEALEKIENDVNNVVAVTASNVNRIGKVEEDVNLIGSRLTTGFNFSSISILSDVVGNNIFYKLGKLAKAEGDIFSYIDNDAFSASYFANIERVVYLEYQNLHIKDVEKGIFPILLYKSDFSPLAVANVEINNNDGSCGTLDLTQYPLAKYAIFNNNGNNTSPLIKMYTSNVEDKEYRNQVLIGAYYFAGFFERTFPNIHNTESILTTYKGRKPFVGWIGCGSFKGEGWAITPHIKLNGGTSTAIIKHSCLFNQKNSCKIFAKEVGTDAWNDVTPNLPSLTTISETTLDLSTYSSKTIQIGFKLTTRASEESAIWTINGIQIISNNIVIYDKDYTDHNNFDLDLTDEDIWKPSVKTMGYNGVNGYVGDTYDYNNYSKIEKEITLAKACGIDYFMLEWFYHDNLSSINIPAIENEENHIGIHAMMNSCSKLDFKFALMITNHSPFNITGLDNWKAAFRYLNDNFFKDPSYLFVDGKPVVTTFNKDAFLEHYEAINEMCISEFGYNGIFFLYVGYNSVPNTGELIERDIADLYQDNKNVNVDKFNIPDLRLGKAGYFIPNITCGWDSRPWADRPSGYARSTDWFVPDKQKWRSFFDWSYDFAKYSTNGNFKSLLICAWNEYGEGSYLAPTAADPRGETLCVIRDVKKCKNL